jgi:hypothetical protein
MFLSATAARLFETIHTSREQLAAISEERASAKPYAEKWSCKEILGHLIDSVGNNHQRIVRMQEMPNIGVFRYNQVHWVSSQKYQLEPWSELVELWYRYNAHLVHIIRHMDPSSLDNLCDVGKPAPVTLHYIVTDYIDHLGHHLRQIFSEEDPRHRTPRTGISPANVKI